MTKSLKNATIEELEAANALATPRADALLLVINEGRTYETDGPLADLTRQLEIANVLLVEALRECLQFVTRTPYGDYVRAEAEAAIAKGEAE